MLANRKRQRSDSVAVHALPKKVKQASPEADVSATSKDDKSAVPENEEKSQTSGPFIYTTPKTDAQSSDIHLLFFSFDIEERMGIKAWPRAAVREIWALIKDLPEDEQEAKLEALDCVKTFPLVQVNYSDEDVESGEGGKMYDVAIQAIDADDEHSGWQDVVLQREKPQGGVPALELKLDGEPQGSEDPGWPYHGRWWWVSSQPASAEDEPAIKKIGSVGLSEWTGLWEPEGDAEGSEGGNGSGAEDEDG
ncbi:unnamed protein product [Peniophora sp. CBMAI 1063]|nr:unnamed protein product [Peniophora sp. CBMAI 1063]